MPTRYIGSGRTQEGGFGAVHKQDFNAHVTGGDWRHGAPDIDMEPVVTGVGGNTVQEAIENLANIVQSDGSGFISIGSLESDGYAAGAYNVGAPGLDTLADAFNAAVADERLANGGYILLLAGTYRTANTINIPAGISVMGEHAGTVVIGQMGELPMFHFLAGSTRPTLGGNSGSGEEALLEGTPIDESRLLNLVLADNLDGYITSGGAPISTMQTTPMVTMAVGSRLHVQNVKFLGRINNGTVAGRNKTLRGIGTIGTGGSTHLTVERCFFDGMETAIRFTPLNGGSDTLTLLNNRARTFGTEDAGSVDASDNCFVSLSFCNLVARGNHHVGFGTFGTQYVASCFVIRSVGANTNGSMTITGTTGGPSSGAESIKSVLFDETSTGFKAIVSGNNWASDTDNRWFVTVGDGVTLADDTFGDFTGSNAIDLLLSTSYEYPMTVIVNAGTYAVTSLGNSRYNFIANYDASSANRRPIFNMSLPGSASTDPASNRIFETGSVLEGIRFVGTGTFTSINPGGAEGSTEGISITNCSFEDSTLYVEPDISSSHEHLRVTNCHFDQTGTFADNVSIILPAMEQTVLDGCYFTGSGYAGFIGDDSDLDPSIVNIQNCIFSKVGETITGNTPLGASEGYLIIATDSHVNFLNNVVITDASYATEATVVSASLDTTFLRFIQIDAKEIFIDGCTVHGVNQTKDISSTDYALATMELIPRSSIKISNSRFYAGLIQIGNSVNALTNALGGGITIDNCSFSSVDSSYDGQCLLDIDINPTSGNDNKQISISNCNFYCEPRESNLTPVYHGASGNTYDSYGIVQVFTDGFPVSFTNNTVGGFLRQTKPSGKDHVAAIAIDTTRPSGAVNLVPVIVYGNNVQITNQEDSGTGTESASCLRIDGTNVQVTGNYMRLSNGAIPAGSVVSCVYMLTNQTGGGDDPSPGIIANNTFSRRNAVGSATTLVSGFVNIDSAAREGSAFGNIFSDDTVDGSDEEVFNDSSSRWRSFNNINEYYTIITRGEVGNLGLHDNTVADGVYLLVGGAGLGSSLASAITVDPTSISSPIVFGYQDTGDDVNFKWFIPLQGLLPWGATITEVEVTVDVTSNPTTTSTSELNVVAGGTSTDTQASLTTAGHTHTLTGISRQVNSNSYSYIVLESEVNSSGTLNYSASPMTIKYKL